MFTRGSEASAGARSPGRLDPAPSRPESAAMSSLGPKHYDAFLSYNAFDREVVEELANRLRDRGLKLYLESWELLPGREFQPNLAAALIESQTCVAFLGPNGLGPWQVQEIQAAIDRRVRDQDFHVIPVLLPGAERPRAGKSPTSNS